MSASRQTRTAAKTTLRLQSVSEERAEAFESGAEAYRRGRRTIDNPHQAGTELHRAWLVGYEAEESRSR